MDVLHVLRASFSGTFTPAALVFVSLNRLFHFPGVEPDHCVNFGVELIRIAGLFEYEGICFHASEICFDSNSVNANRL